MFFYHVDGIGMTMFLKTSSQLPDHGDELAMALD